MAPTTSAACRPPFPPFTRESAVQKVRLAEDAWNTRDPGKVALAYAIDESWQKLLAAVESKGKELQHTS